MFVNETKIDVETTLKADLYMSKIQRLLFIAVIPPVFVLLGIALIFVDASWFFPVFLFVFAVISVIFFAFFYPLILRKLIKRAMGGKERGAVYTFREEDFDIVTEDPAEGENAQGESYAAYTKCEEYPDMWILYRGNMVSVLLKDAMTEGTEEDFCVFLAVKLGDKYLMKDKSKKNRLKKAKNA